MRAAVRTIARLNNSERSESELRVHNLKLEVVPIFRLQSLGEIGAAFRQPNSPNQVRQICQLSSLAKLTNYIHQLTMAFSLPGYVLTRGTERGT